MLSGGRVRLAGSLGLPTQDVTDPPVGVEVAGLAVSRGWLVDLLALSGDRTVYVRRSHQ